MGKRVVKHGKVLAPLIVGMLVLGGISSVAVNGDVLSGINAGASYLGTVCCCWKNI